MKKKRRARREARKVDADRGKRAREIAQARKRREGQGYAHRAAQRENERLPDMAVAEFGKYSLYRPRPHVEAKVRYEAETHLRGKFSPGDYRDRNEINSILHHRFGFHERRFRSLLPLIASRDALEFLLHQYDVTAAIADDYKAGRLSPGQEQYWGSISRDYRRALKFCCEMFALQSPGEASRLPRGALMDATDEFVIHAEEMVALSALSTQTFAVFPDDTVYTVYPPGAKHVEDLRVNRVMAEDLPQRIRIDTNNRSRFVPSPQFDRNPDEHARRLSTVLLQSMGISYGDALALLRTADEASRPPPSGFPTLFVRKADLIAGLAEDSGYNPEIVTRVLTGFTITKELMDQEGREIWKPKQEYRAFRRGMIEFPHHTDAHLAWSRGFFREALVHLISAPAYQQFPSEWRSSDVDRALSRLANDAGGWFEDVVAGNLRRIGVQNARAYRKQIGVGARAVKIPAEVGDIDILGYLPETRALVVAECKMAFCGPDPDHMRQDLDRFVRGKNNYHNQLIRKTAWVRDNLTAIASALTASAEFAGECRPHALSACMITLYPTVATYFIKEHPCLTITELMMQAENEGWWPIPIERV